MRVPKSRKEVRQQHILSALEANPAVRVNQLADELTVSTETIRRDLTELQQIGRISRTYGGAVGTSNRFEPVLNERMTLHITERRAIAREAAATYAQEDALLLGGGATMLHFARALREVQHRLTVITPAYPIAVELAGNPLIDVMLLPGRLEPQEHIVYGPETQRAVERYAVRTAIIGVSGINTEGFSEALLDAGEVYSAILRSAEQVVVLVDHSKFGKRALVLLSEWSPRVTLVTDSPPPEPLATVLARNGTSVVLAKTGKPGL